MEPEDLTVLLLARAGVVVPEAESDRASRMLARPREQKAPQIASEPATVHIPKSWGE